MIMNNIHVAESFSRAANHYDDVSIVQKEIGNRLLQRLAYIKMLPQAVLDLGCGTGYLLRDLQQHYPQAESIALDLAPQMLRVAKSKFPDTTFYCADAQHIPLENDSVDLVISNLMLQWCDDYSAVFAECFRVLKPNGLLLFSTFGPDTLHELRQSWQAVSSDRHVIDFVDMHHLGDALMQSKFLDPVMDREVITIQYQQALALMKDLKQLGASIKTSDRRKRLTTPKQLQLVLDAYEQFRDQQKLPATYEVIYGLAWMPADKKMSIPAGAEVNFSLSQFRQMLSS